MWLLMMMHSSHSWTEPYMRNTSVQLSPKYGKNPTSVSNLSLTTLLLCCPLGQKIIHRTEAIFSFNNSGTTNNTSLLLYKTAITREIKMILFFHLEAMDFSSIKRLEKITVLSLQIFQWKWSRLHVAVLMHCFDEATEMPLATYVKTYIPIFA